jgi:signal transduction histidine kinase/CheY-like chemotaxis protein
MVFKYKHEHYLQKLPLSAVLIVPFILQIFSAVGLVGYLSFKNGQKAVNSLALNLSNEIGGRVDQHLTSYLSLPHQLASTAVDNLETGILDLHDFKSAERYLWKRAQIYPTIAFIGYYLENGEGVGAQRWPPGQGVNIVRHSLADGKDYNYATDAQGQRTKLLDATKYFAPADEWYVDAVKAGKAVWSRIYTAEGFPGYVAASASYPIYSPDHQLLGALSVDLLLSDISRFLRRLEVSPNSRVFIMERNGLLIGNSGSQETYKVIKNQTHRINALHSPDPTIQATAQYLQAQFGNFKAIQQKQQLVFSQGKQKFWVQVLPWRDNYGLDWLVVVTIPQSDFMAAIAANTRTTIGLCLVALAIATILGIYTSRWISAPLSQLSRASQAIAQGDFSQTAQVKRTQELSTLSQAFNRMAEQLKSSFELLETRVAERTAQLAEAKEAADAANQAKSKFLASMSHELRTPLNVILGFTQLMERDSSLNQAQGENLKMIARSGEHLLSLINDVLDMAKIEAGRIDLNESNLDLYSLLHTIGEMLRVRANEKSLSFEMQRADNVPQYIQGDEKKLRQVLLNLLGNAIKFTQVGRVSLQVKLIEGSDPHLYFAVEDTGPGIDPCELETIFEPFVQTESGRNSQQGTGLGLSISRQFVQMMHGEIRVHSVKGQGTRFEFDIPVKLSEEIPMTQPQITRYVVGLEPGQPQYRILIADDRWENRQVLIKLLQPIGFEVQEAANGEEVIALWESWHPHLIWMDVQMPVLNGIEATQHIKRHPQGQSTCIIALTASVMAEERAMILSSGFDDFAEKPFLESEIFDKIAQFVEVKYIYQEKMALTAELSTSQLLTQLNLALMPETWLAALAEASARLDPQAIAQLLEQIPGEQIALKQALQATVNNFDFDILETLARQIGKP